MRALLEQFKEWTLKYIDRIADDADWDVTPCFVRHGHSRQDVPYIAMMKTPPCWLYDEALGYPTNPLPHALDHCPPKQEPGGMWISIHCDEQDAGRRVFVVPNGVGKWEIIKGAEGGVVGARLTHLLSIQDYKAVQNGAS